MALTSHLNGKTITKNSLQYQTCQLQGKGAGGTSIMVTWIFLESLSSTIQLLPVLFCAILFFLLYF